MPPAKLPLTQPFGVVSFAKLLVVVGHISTHFLPLGYIILVKVDDLF